MSKLKVVGAAVAIAIALFAYDSFARSQNAEWEERVASVQAQARLERDAAIAHLARADSLEAEVDVLQHRVSNRGAVIVGLRAAIADAPVPEEAIPAITLRDELIEEQDDQIIDLVAAVAIERSAAAELRLGLSDAISRGDSLDAVLSDRPRPRPSFLPRMSVGPFIGFCADGTSCVGVGLHLSWEVKLF